MGWNIIKFMSAREEAREYQPERLSRRGEITAWILAAVVGAAWLVVWLNGSRPGAAFPLLEAFLLLAALSISLGNWMDRRTRLRVDESGVAFTNGLRNVTLTWSEIDQVRVLPGGWGKRVQVLGRSDQGKPAYFSFRTSGVVRVQGEEKGRMGFEAGDEILQEMIERSGLQAVERTVRGEIYSRS